MAKARVSGSVATASVDITVPLSKLARALGQARALSHRVVSSMGRHIMATMTRAWTMAAASVKLFSRAMLSVGRTIKSVLGPMMLLLAPLVGVAGLIGTLTAFGKFEAQMSKVKGVTRATAEDFKKLWDQAKQLGATTAFSASQSAEAMSNFAIAGFSVKEIMDSMKPTLDLAAAGALDMATASDIVIGMLKGMGLETSELSTAVDTMVNAFTGANIDLVLLGESFKTMGPVGKAAGKGIQELAAAIMALGDAGLKGADSGTAMRNLLLRLQAQPSEVKKALKELGMEIDDGSGSMKHMSVIIDELNDKMSGYTMMQKSALIMQLAGTRAAASLNILLARGGDELRRLEELLGAEGSAAKLAATMLDNLKGSWTILMSALEGAAISLGETIAPAFRKIVEALQPLTGVLGQVLEKLKPVVDWWGGRMVAGIKTSTTWLSAHVDMFERWGNRAAEIIQNVEAMWLSFVKMISKKLGITAGGIFEGMVSILDKAIESLAALVASPALGFAGLKDTIIAGFYYGSSNVVEAIMKAFAGVSATLQSVGAIIGNNWEELLDAAWQNLKTVFNWFWETGKLWGSWFLAEFEKVLKALVGAKRFATLQYYGAKTAGAPREDIERFRKAAFEDPEEAAAQATKDFEAALTSPIEGFKEAGEKFVELQSSLYDEILAELRKTILGDAVTSLSALGDAAQKRADEAWSKARADAASKRVGGGGDKPSERGIFGRSKEDVAAGWAKIAAEEAEAFRKRDEERNRVAFAQRRPTAAQRFAAARPELAQRRAEARMAVNRLAKERILARYEAGEIEIGEAEDLIAKIGGKGGAAGGGVAAPGKEEIAAGGKGGEVRMMGLQEYLAQLQADLTKKDKEDLIAKGVTSTATNTSDGGPIVKELVAIKNKKGVAGFA